MNGYDALSARMLASHNSTKPTPQPATSPQIPPRDALPRLREAYSSGDSREAVLTTKQRNRLPRSAFAIPEDRAYPIHDLAHARNALARVSQFGSDEEKRRVRNAVYRRYPQLNRDRKSD